MNISIFSNDNVVCLLYGMAVVVVAWGGILLCLEILMIVCPLQLCLRCPFEVLQNTYLDLRNNFPDVLRCKMKMLYWNYIFYGKKSVYKNNEEINIGRMSNASKITLVLIMLRLMRLNFRFRAQYMNGFQKLLLNAIHVMMKSTAGGI